MGNNEQNKGDLNYITSAFDAENKRMDKIRENKQIFLSEEKLWNTTWLNSRPSWEVQIALFLEEH